MTTTTRRETSFRMIIALLGLALSMTGVPAVTFTTDTAIPVGDTSYDGQPIIVSGCTLTVDGPHTFASLLLTNAGIVTHSPWSAQLTNNRVELVTGDAVVAGGSTLRGNAALTVQGDFNLGTNAQMIANGTGYPIGTNGGPGVGGQSPWRGGGGGHGGLGGSGSGEAGPAPGGIAYGDPLAPAEWGSSGGDGSYGPGAPGGGAIRLQVSGTLTVDGVLSANGGNAGDTRSGGGSGGSLWITTGALAGTGAIHANGGNGNHVYGGGGSGGRVAIHFESSLFLGTMTASGGSGAQRGGAGTLFLRKSPALAGVLTVGNGGLAGAVTPLEFAGGVSTLMIDQGAVCIPEVPLVVTSLVVGSGGLLTHRAGQGNVSITASHDATVYAGGSISANGLGYFNPTNAGPGAGIFIPSPMGPWACTGAGHGGTGGNSYLGGVGGAAYGSIPTPTHYGSLGGSGLEGAGGAGGGAIRLIVGDRLTVNGSITANGLNAVANNAGGGSGGSVWLDVGALDGNGTISANGGNGEASEGGGGGGGRVAVEFSTNAFAGAITASGGGSRSGGSGTVYVRRKADAYGSVRLEGSGSGNFSGVTPILPASPFHLSLSNYAVVTFPQPATLASLTVGPNGRVTFPTNGVPLDLVILSNATVAAGGQILADGFGYPIAGDDGPGSGNRIEHGGSGGGHGGSGGASWTGAAGGRTNGNPFEPVTFGSQGGASLEGLGSAGGGVIRLTVGGTLALHGRVSANGLNTPVNNAGGGAGGSVYLAVGKLIGSGSLWAMGGVGEFHEGGGGGGGRVAVLGDVSGFDTNNLLVTGGGGYQAGTNGTIHFGDYLVPKIVESRPAGFTTQAPDHFDLDFNQGMDGATLTPDDIVVVGPAGVIPSSQIDVVNVGGRTWRVSFPPQTSNGSVSYTLAAGARSLFGLAMTTPYQGGFDIRLERYLLASKAGNTLRLDWATSPGRTYQLQISPDLMGWSDFGPGWPGTGGMIGTNITFGGTGGEFLRLRITE